jgi:hypothetical protein
VFQRLSCVGPRRWIERRPNVPDAQDVASDALGAVSKKVDETLAFRTRAPAGAAFGIKVSRRTPGGTTILASGDVYCRVHKYFRFKERGDRQRYDQRNGR